MASLQLLRTPVYLLGLLPLAVPAVAWWREAMWFKAADHFEVSIQVALFFALVAVAIYLPLLLVLSRAKTKLRLVLVTMGLATAAWILGKEAVHGLVTWGYSQELRAYTSVVALAAGKRTLVFLVCTAAVPFLVATLLIFVRSPPSPSAGTRDGAA